VAQNISNVSVLVTSIRDVTDVAQLPSLTSYPMGNHPSICLLATTQFCLHQSCLISMLLTICEMDSTYMPSYHKLISMLLTICEMDSTYMPSYHKLAEA